ncbi:MULTISPECIES: ATP-dependent DNA ligase [unclassified Streptomyces]|uniref:ATP-dependent DNA ligase n=1 Tax=unclassified Streptomyces TaxID=2593676 RepID=UPI000BACA161|nr:MULTISPECIES: ATP-dependent DNA ligase [unclassified Streptomyces]ASY37036.1 ATP-dependent DNA ligase [Streptomyces sp. CLI2509]MYX23502.1 ATP-dependent DNA ligase [Streptomyces sp. SID8380]
MEYPVQVALARAAPALPSGAGWWFEPKFDGDRCVLWRQETVRLQSRAGRDVTVSWPDIATGAMDLPRGTVLDGELVIYQRGRLDFGAVRSRASARGRRLQDLVARRPASYAAFDVLMYQDHDVRSLTYEARRALLLNVLADFGPPLQAVPATDDLDVARAWMMSLRSQGVEGLVAKRGGGPYRAGRQWVKIRHAETVDGIVTGYQGQASRPSHLFLLLPDGRTVRSQRLPGALASELGRHLPGHDTGTARDPGTGPLHITDARVTVEVLAGTTRHAAATVTRVRD